jgi:E3 ubiquitin-protein ligase SHPRH
MTASVRLAYHGAAQLEANELPFQLLVDVDIALMLPLPPTTRLKSDTAEAQRRFLSHVLSEDTTFSHHDSQSTGYYYSILRSAPPISAAVAAALQPEGLQAALVPFQRRTLAVMLAQEGLAFDEQGNMVACNSTPDLPLLWKRLQAPWSEDSDLELYYNNVTGELREEPPTFIHYPGLFVAEEMGLGA